MIEISDLRPLFLSDTPMIDTRAPVEFQKGSFPLTQNLPLMTDSEREQVGTCYKQQGQQAAIELGHRLVHGEVKQARVEQWLAFKRQHPQGVLFCWRGGLRSQICQQWLHEAGCDVARIKGGYKAMRQFLLEQLQQLSASRPLMVLAGYTGSAKTRLLLDIPNSIDLEGLAHHRGSAFGKRPGGQPPQISFENSLAVALLKQAEYYPQQATVVEDESRLIGQLSLPDCVRDAMSQAPLVVVDTELRERVEHTYFNYILQALSERVAVYGEEAGFQRFSEYLTRALYNIRRRLGGTRYAQLNELLQSALRAHQKGDPDSHRSWIEPLLSDYYDPMYRYQMQKVEDRVIFSGSAAAVTEFLNRGVNR